MKLIIQIFALGVACYGLIGALLYFFQEKMLFFPMGQTFGECHQMDRYGARAVNTDGIRCYLKPSQTAESWIVVFHGNAGSACDRTYFFDLLAGCKAHIVLFEYPGYGGDGRRPGENLILENGLELINKIKTGAMKHHAIRDSNDENLPIFLLGESLGTGVATWVSTKTQTAGLILISAYTAIVDVARYHYPWLPVRYLLKHRFEASAWAAQTNAPAILFHGIDDDIIPIEFARKQVKNYRSDARLIEISNCGHNDIVDTAEKMMEREICQFISAAGVKHPAAGLDGIKP